MVYCRPKLDLNYTTRHDLTKTRHCVALIFSSGFVVDHKSDFSSKKNVICLTQ